MDVSRRGLLKSGAALVALGIDFTKLSAAPGRQADDKIVSTLRERVTLRFNGHVEKLGMLVHPNSREQAINDLVSFIQERQSEIDQESEDSLGQPFTEEEVQGRKRRIEDLALGFIEDFAQRNMERYLKLLGEDPAGSPGSPGRIGCAVDGPY